MQNYVCRHTLLLRCDAPPLAQILPQILASLRHWTCTPSHATGGPTHRSRNHHFRQPLGCCPANVAASTCGPFRCLAKVRANLSVADLARLGKSPNTVISLQRPLATN